MSYISSHQTTLKDRRGIFSSTRVCTAHLLDASARGAWIRSWRVYEGFWGPSIFDIYTGLNALSENLISYGIRVLSGPLDVWFLIFQYFCHHDHHHHHQFSFVLKAKICRHMRTTLRLRFPVGIVGPQNLWGLRQKKLWEKNSLFRPIIEAWLG